MASRAENVICKNCGHVRENHEFASGEQQGVTPCKTSNCSCPHFRGV